MITGSIEFGKELKSSEAWVIRNEFILDIARIMIGTISSIIHSRNCSWMSGLGIWFVAHLIPGIGKWYH